MKKLLNKLFLLTLVISTYQVKAEVELVPLNMELGYWETTSEMNIDAILASVPESQRAMVGAMISNKMKIPVIKQCITQKSLEDMEAQMKESFNAADNDCDLQVVKSTSLEFSGVLTCAGGTTTLTVNTKSINAKRMESQVVADMGEMGKSNITTIGEWKSATCP